MMNKNRIEALSDGVFAIVMTLLVIEIRVPHLMQSGSGQELIEKLWSMWPLFRSYYISFAVLGVYWLAHHALFHLFAKQANRAITYLNILFLCFISLIPFSAHLIGEYPLNHIAVTVYGINIIAIGIVQYTMLQITIKDTQIVHETVTDHLIKQATVRMLLPTIFAVLGIIAGFYHSSLSFFLFAFPIIFNIIPGSLSFLERIFMKK